MALFNKLFQPKRSTKSEKSQHIAFENDYIPFTFDKTQVRVLLFRECDRRGRKLLYDSSCNQTDSIPQNEKKECKNNIPKIRQNNQENDCVNQNDFQNRYVEPDTTLLGEMIFGSVALNYNGLSCKIHVMKSPERLMCTKVYCNVTRKISSNEGSESCNGNTSMHSDGDLYSTSKLSPWPSYNRTSQFSIFTTKDDRLTVNCLNKNDSGFSSQPSSHSNISCQSSSYELWNRNEEMFQSDLMYASSSHCGVDSGSFHLYPSQHYSSGFETQTSLPNIPARRKDSQISRSSVNSSISECLDHSDKHTSRRIKIGIAIIINLGDSCKSSMMTFLLDHAVFIEGAIVKLKYAAHKALCSHQAFVCTMKAASSEVAQWLVDLLSSPRIKCPIWPNLSTCKQILTKRKLADVFVNDLCSLLSTMDTKDTYFFMSTLLTNILTFHLGWVNSVGSSENNSAYIQHYNPLQTQLREMYGVIGLPAQASRTIVYGKQNYLLVRKILTILTYFIRSVSVNKFEIEETCLSWENVDDLITDGRSQEKTLEFTDCIDQNTQSSTVSGDIEMKIFTGHKSTAVLKCVETSMFESRTSLFLSGVEELNETKVYSESISPKRLAPVIDVTEDILPNINSNGMSTANLDEYKCNPTKNENSSHLKVMEYKSGKAVSDSSAVRRLTRVSTGGLLSNFIGVSDQQSSQSVNTLTKTVSTQFSNPNLSESNESGAKDNNNVLFILGDNEELVGLRDTNNRTHTNDSLPGSDVESNTDVNGIPDIKVDDTPFDVKNCCSKQLESCCECKSRCQHSSKKHSGVKFDFEKYPQIVTNYMKSKNLDLLDRDVIGKADSLKFVESEESEAGSSIINLSKNCDTCQNCSFTAQGLQTPSNASELEYTSDIPDHEFQYAKECLISSDKSKIEEPKVFVKKKLSNTVVVNEIKEENLQSEQEKPSESDMITELPLNNVSLLKPKDESHKNGYYDSLFGSVSDHYISDFVLQGGVGGLKSDWEKSLSQDLKLQPGTTCLLADIDEWSVRVFSSGGRVIGDMSTLVASMLDCIPQMCHAKVPSLQCLAFIESKLREICVRSKGLAQLLIDKDFCDMEYLTKTLDLEPNDVPLLLAIASTHTPQATLKYGISYT